MCLVQLLRCQSLLAELKIPGRGIMYCLTFCLVLCLPPGSGVGVDCVPAAGVNRIVRGSRGVLRVLGSQGPVSPLVQLAVPGIPKSCACGCICLQSMLMHLS